MTSEEAIKSKSVCMLETLKNKIKLKECEKKYHGESVEKQMKQNVCEIRKLRQETRQNHRELASKVAADEELIKEVFHDRPRDYLALKRHSAQEAVQSIDQKTCEAAKLFNLVHSIRLAKEERLKKLKYEVTSLEHQSKKRPSELSMEQKIHVIENTLEKVNWKMVTAQQLSEKYRVVVKKLEEQNRLYPSKLKGLETELSAMKEELKTLREGRDIAVQAKEMGKQLLTETERDFTKTRKQRDQVIADTQKKIEENRRRRDHFADKIQQTRRTHRVPSHYRNTRLSAIEGFQLKLLTAQEAFRVLRQNTAITEIADFIERFENQDEVRWRLAEQADQVRKRNDQLKKQKESLWDEYTRLKYNGMTFISEGEQALEDKCQEIANREKDEEQLREDLHVSGNTLLSVKEVFHALLKKISKYFSEEWFASHSLADDIALFSEKIEHLLYEVNLHEEEYYKAARKLQTEGNDTDMTSSNNIRVRLELESESTESFHYDHHESMDVPTRDDIKANGQYLIDARHRKPKKAKKGKRD